MCYYNIKNEIWQYFIYSLMINLRLFAKIKFPAGDRIVFENIAAEKNVSGIADDGGCYDVRPRTDTYHESTFRKRTGQ